MYVVVTHISTLQPTTGLHNLLSAFSKSILMIKIVHRFIVYLCRRPTTRNSGVTGLGRNGMSATV